MQRIWKTSNYFSFAYTVDIISPWLDLGSIPTDNDREWKKKVTKKYKPFQIPRKLPLTLLLSTSYNA